MTTKALQKKTKELEREVELLRSFVIGNFGRDPEGEYKPEFIEDMLAALSGDDIEHEFKDGKSFLKQIRGN